MNELRINEIKLSEIKSDQLRRVAHAATPTSKYFVAIYKFKEVGIVHIGVETPPGSIFIHYLFVMSQFRGLGIGGKLVEVVEQLARENGNPAIELEPGQIDLDFPVSQVEAWYSRRGFQPITPNSTDFIKILNPEEQ